MSIKVMSQVWEHSRHKSGALIVLLAMADFAHDDGTRIFASVETLGRKARLSGRQVQRAIDTLLNSGELVLVKEGGGRHQTNTYRIPPKGGNMSPIETVTFPTEKGDISDRKGDASVTPNRQDPLKNRYARGQAPRKPFEASSERSKFAKATSLKTLRDLKAEALENIDEIIRPGGCAGRVQPTDPKKVARLESLRRHVQAYEAQIEGLLARPHAAG